MCKMWKSPVALAHRFSLFDFASAIISCIERLNEYPAEIVPQKEGDLEFTKDEILGVPRASRRWLFHGVPHGACLQLGVAHDCAGGELPLVRAGAS